MSIDKTGRKSPLRADAEKKAAVDVFEDDYHDPTEPDYVLENIDVLAVIRKEEERAYLFSTVSDAIKKINRRGRGVTDLVTKLLEDSRKNIYDLIAPNQRTVNKKYAKLHVIDWNATANRMSFHRFPSRVVRFALGVTAYLLADVLVELCKVQSIYCVERPAIAQGAHFLDARELANVWTERALRVLRTEARLVKQKEESAAADYLKTGDDNEEGDEENAEEEDYEEDEYVCTDNDQS